MLHASHPDEGYKAIASMLRESLPEYLDAAENALKNTKPQGGVYGYPCGVLLLMIVDAIGSYVIGGKTRDHFNVLNNPDYYGLSLTKAEIDEIYESFRCRLSHNAAMPFWVGLEIGTMSEPVFGQSKFRNHEYNAIRLTPLLDKSKQAVARFIQPDLEDTVKKSSIYRNYFDQSDSEAKHTPNNL